MSAAQDGWPFPGLVWGPYPQQPLPPPRRRAAGWREAAHWRALAQSIARGQGAPEGDEIGRALARAAGMLRETHGVQARWQQLYAARAMAGQHLVEMSTGEGKTYAIALAAAVAAMAGTPVHVVTANDYLARRDATQLASFYARLGLRCGFVAESMRADERRAAHAGHVTYCTARELVFDYLRDGLLQRAASPLAAQLSRRAGPPPVLRGLCMALLDEADTLLVDEARTPFILSQAQSGTGEAFLRACWALAGTLRQGSDFRIGGARQVQLLPAGELRVAAWPAEGDALASHPLHRQEALKLALSALHVLQRDRDYVLRDGRVALVDESTGRAAAGRAWSRGLHQFVELKEGVALTPANEAVSQVTTQRFFARYLRLGGVSGTLREARAELRRVYGLRLLRVPDHQPRRVPREPTRVFATSADLWPAAAARAAHIAALGRPVLVGTGSVADSEALAACLRAAAVPFQLLHARQDAREAEVVAGAGAAGCITIATSMAGRGTDVLLSATALQAGGLHVLLCQANASRRIDRQFLGRAGRQGQPGSSEHWLALDFPLFVRWLPAWARRGLAAARPANLLADFLLRCTQGLESYAQSQQRVTLSRWAEAEEKNLAFSTERLP